MFIGKWDVERKEDFLYEGSCRIHKVDGISVWFFGVLYNKKTLGYDPAANEAKIIIEIYREKGYTGFARLDGSFTCLLRTPDSAVIFRDHHGTSYQVYYTSQYFSSSLMRLKDMDGFTAVPNYKALSSFLSIGYIETPMCALEGVCKLGAGELPVMAGWGFEKYVFISFLHHGSCYSSKKSGRIRGRICRIACRGYPKTYRL